MPNAVTDTHTLIWYLQDDSRLSRRAADCFEACKLDTGRIRIPSICVVEIIYLTEKGRIPSDTLGLVLTELVALDTIFEVVGLDLNTALRLMDVPRQNIADMPDRLIAATALKWNLPLITRDRGIQCPGLVTMW